MRGTPFREEGLSLIPLSEVAGLFRSQSDFGFCKIAGPGRPSVADISGRRCHSCFSSNEVRYIDLFYLQSVSVMTLRAPLVEISYGTKQRRLSDLYCDGNDIDIRPSV